MQAYGKVFLSKTPVSNHFRPEPFYLTKLCTLSSDANFLSVKVLLYSLCADFDGTGVTYTQYVQEYRISEACSLLSDTDKTVLQTAYECGFDSLRTFNRNFAKITGVSPSEYREQR